MSGDTTKETTVYLQVEGAVRRTRYGVFWDRLSVKRMTNRKPDKPLAGTVTFKVTPRLPAEAFLPLEPEATVVVPLSMTERNEGVLVEARDPHDVPVEDPGERR